MSGGIRKPYVLRYATEVKIIPWLGMLEIDSVPLTQVIVSMRVVQKARNNQVGCLYTIAYRYL